jgi:hypothetical protein
LLDLSVSLKNIPHADPPGLGPQIEYRGHQQSFAGPDLLNGGKMAGSGLRGV